MIYIAVLCNSRITAEPLYNTPLFIGPYAAANNTALLAWRPSQGTKLYCCPNNAAITSPTPYRYTTERLDCDVWSSYIVPRHFSFTFITTSSLPYRIQLLVNVIIANTADRPRVCKQWEASRFLLRTMHWNIISLSSSGKNWIVQRWDSRRRRHVLRHGAKHGIVSTDWRSMLVVVGLRVAHVEELRLNTSNRHRTWSVTWPAIKITVDMLPTRQKDLVDRVTLSKLLRTRSQKFKC